MRTSLLLGAAAGAAMAYAVRGRSSAWFGESVWRGDARRQAMALTFDDGPSESTPKLLRILDRYGARATFFQCGVHARRLPEIARDVSQAGHEIGNHTYTHPLLSLRSPAFIDHEVRAAQESIAEAAGAMPVLFRAPYGVRWFGLDGVQRRYRLLGVMWTVLGRDWRLGAGAITQRVLRRASNGAIVCLHDGRELHRAPDVANTIEAAGNIVPALLDRGFRLQTVSELLCPTS